MTRIYKAFILAIAMLVIATLAVFEVIPEAIAQSAPIALLAVWPSAWTSQHRTCGAST